mgnify:CR=1 FL=1
MIYLKLLWIFFKIGLFTIGGGYAMIPMIESEIISAGWITEEELLNFIAISESTPGPFAINIATFVGFSQAGILGSIASTVGVILPSLIIIIIISKIIAKFLNNKYVNYALMGVRPVVVGLILSVAFSLIYTGLTNISSIYNLFSDFNIHNFSFASLIIMVIVFTLSRFKKLNKPIFLILISAVLGIIFFGLLQMK